MLTKWLRTLNTLDRLGVALARLIEAGLSWRTTGRAATTNGRIWFWTIGVLGLASAASAALAAGSERAAGSRLVAAGPSWVANVCTLVSVAVVCASVAGRSLIARLMFASWEAKARNTFELESTSETIWPCLAPARCSAAAAS